MRTVKPQVGRRSQIAELLSEGLSTPVIAERLRMTGAAVRNQVAKIKKDLGWQAR